MPAQPDVPVITLRELNRAALADHRHLDLTRILELGLDLAGDLVRKQVGPVVVDLGRPDDDADLAAGLQRVDPFDAFPPPRELFERREALDVVLQALSASTRPRR